MATYATMRHSRVIEYTREGRIVTLHFGIDAPTKAINVTRLRSDTPHLERTAFAVLGPSGESPMIGIDPDQTTIIDALQNRFDRFGVEPVAPVRRHRGGRRGPMAWLLAAVKARRGRHRAAA